MSKRITIPAILLVLAMLLCACAELPTVSSESAEPSETHAPTPTEAVSPTPEPTATPVPTDRDIVNRKAKKGETAVSPFFLYG